MKTSERVAAIGVGYSTTGRYTGLSPWELAIQAARAAMDDAGLSAADIDGVSSLVGVSGAEPPGLLKPHPMDLGYSLGMSPLNWWTDGPMPGPAYVGPALMAIAAIRAGFAHTVLALRVVFGPQPRSAQVSEPRVGPDRIDGDMQFGAPFGASAGVINIGALPAQRYMERFGATEEQFGAHVIAQREFAALNEEALFREKLTLDDYLASRYIAKPLRLLDCDYPVDSASAVIFTAGDRARDGRHKPVFVDAATHSSIKYQTFENLEDVNHSAPFHAAEELWNRTELTPADVDCAQLYDGFTIIVFQWLEALGFCGLGEAGSFVEAGNTALGGSLPVNTDGGACNVGRRHGANFCIESIRQLRGECGPRQVEDAEVAVWVNAVGPYSGAVLMTAG